MAKTLEEVLSESGIELNNQSPKKGYCPFHKEDTPSFSVYETGTYYCFGCGVWGDAVKFLVDYKGISPRKALEIVGLDYVQPRAEKSKVIKVKNTVNTWKFLYSVVSQYHDYLMKLPGAVQYLLSRGLTMETIKKYKLGYTDGMVLNLMYAWERELADEIGIMTRNGFEVMSHRVVVPNLIDKNQADFISGRTILNDKVKYLHARMPKPLIGFYEVRKSPIIFTVEGHFDWLTLMQWGYPAVCIAGSSTKSYSLLPLQEKEVVIIPDLDDGEGMKAANSIKSQLGDRAVILDYSALKTDANKLDISALAEREDGEESFRQVIVQELPWLTRISNIERWFPQLI